ncbi:unnamed protein product [Pelagomonas calceolata]|uniref:Inosine/uridine-preferring nucleoside hydrolase domain-containing protein n=1 Tax=Pelagomonas calceolata TaxID=35677 RepID=A0A8J2T121_9STRA|nr:unnamed protein product [Pelagomonas calceolata]
MRHLYLLAAAAAGQPQRIWIDADCDGFHDAAAISQLSKYNIIGASAVFGSATVVEAQRKCSDVLRKANIDVEVTAGASHYEDTQAANKAVGAMTHELAKAIKDNEKMTVVALGTLTNVAALAVRRPDLAESLHVVITCATNDPSDVCVTKDWQALAALLRSPADMTMAPPAPPAAWDDVSVLPSWLSTLITGPTRDPTIDGALQGARCEAESAWLMPINEDFHDPRFVLETGELPEWPTKATALRPDSIGLSGSLERCWGAHDARRRLVDDSRSEL